MRGGGIRVGRAVFFVRVGVVGLEVEESLDGGVGGVGVRGGGREI